METIKELVEQLQAAAIISGESAKVLITEDYSSTYSGSNYKPVRVEAYQDCVRIYIQRT